MPEFSVSLAPEIAPPAVMVVANFGIVAGRRAAQAEIEKLWQTVRTVVPQATITVEDHNQFGKRTSTCVHQVSVAVGDDVVRRANQDPELLRRQLEETLERWVTACAGHVQGEMTLAERRARRAVIADDSDGDEPTRV
jgi:Flp pilus assembly secretin CpaC